MPTLFATAIEPELPRLDAIGQALLKGMVICVPIFFGAGLIWLFWALWRRRSPAPYEPRRDVPWDGFLVLPVVLLALFSISHSLSAPAEPAAPPGSVSPMDPAAVLASGISLTVVITSLFVLVAIFGAQAKRDDLGVSGTRIGHDIKLGILATLLLLLPILGLQHLLTSYLDIPSEHPLVKIIKQDPSAINLALLILSAVIAAPICEELVYRVVVQGWLEKALRKRNGVDAGGNAQPPQGWRGWLPIILSSALFAAVHLRLQNGQLQSDPIPLFLFALALGYVYRQTHRLWPSLIMHMLLNLFSSMSLLINIVHTIR